MSSSAATSIRVPAESFDARTALLAKVVPVAAVLLAFALAAWVAIVRAPYWDEGLYGGVAVNFAENNVFGSSVMHPDGAFGHLPRSNERTYWTTPLYPLVLGLWCKVAGTGIVAVRMLSLLLAVPFFFCWWYILRQLTGSASIASIGVALISLDTWVLRAMFLARPDMLAAACGTGGVALYLRLRETRLHLASALAVALIALAGLAHPAAATSAAMLGVVAAASDLRRFRGTHLACAGVAGALVLLPWALYVLADLELFRQQWAGALQGRRHGTLNPILMLWGDITNRYFKEFFASRSALQAVAAINPIGIAAALVWAAWDRSCRADGRTRLIAAMAMAAFAMLAFVDGSRFPQYFLHVFPVYTAAAVWALAWQWNKGTRARRAATAVLAVVIMLPGIGSALYATRKLRWSGEFASMLDAVRSVRPAGQTVNGPSELAFALGFDGSVIDDRHMRTESPVVVYNANIKLASRAAESLLHQKYRPVYQNPVWTVYVLR